MRGYTCNSLYGSVLGCILVFVVSRINWSGNIFGLGGVHVWNWMCLLIAFRAMILCIYFCLFICQSGGGNE